MNLKKRNKNRNKVINIVIPFIVLLFAVYLCFRVSDRKKHLSKGDIKYCVGQIVKFQRGANVAPWFTFEFYINDEINKGRFDIQDSLSLLNNFELKKYVGKSYLVKYSVEKPIYSELFFNKPIPDSLKKCEKCNWDKLPF